VTASVQTPQLRVELACRKHGAFAVADACMRLLAGAEIDPVMRAVFGDQHSPKWLESDVNQYWLRVWGARGLLWNWDSRAVDAVRTALSDEAWRVREMALKVIARHRVDDLQPLVTELVDDPVPRVRAAASRALTLLAGGGEGR
jgi:HEAT repeat protein